MLIFFNIEKIESVYNEFLALLSKHCTEAVPDIVKPENVDFTIYYTLEHANALHIVTARNSEKKLVGYAIYMIAPDSHNKSRLTATSDAFYMEKKYRGWEGVKLLRYAETSLKQKGIESIVNVLPFDSDVKILMKRQGYKEISVQYIKNLRS